MMHRNQSVNVHQFAMVPRADIPRSTFNIETSHKTTFDAGYLIPIFCEEVLPGDTMSVKMTAFARLATPIFPVMDNLHLDSFFFFVPNRLVWKNWVKFMGEQDYPGESISYTVPIVAGITGGYAVGSLGDYFGLPTYGQVGGGNAIGHNALPFRAYNLIWNQWFRDENLQGPATILNDDGPDPHGYYVLRRRGKRHDYFTSALPWPQKGNTAVSLPLGTTAPIKSDGNTPQFTQTGQPASSGLVMTNGSNAVTWSNNGTAAASQMKFGAVTGLYADLSTATAATINQLRQAFQIQRLLERDARGGTRYTELIRAHFGVISPDARLQRPEYLGGGSAPIVMNPIAQTSGTGASGQTTPLGNLAAIGTMMANNHGFTQSFTEHGHIIGLVSVRADLNYQQGMRKLWLRNTRYDYYFPAFAMLGEQTIINKEIYADGSANDTGVFGYQERWAEYRYSPPKITGLFRSTSIGTLDAWHLAQKFTSLPVLGDTFIQETPPLSRVLAVGAAANGAQLIFDSFFRIRATRPMPLFSVPGLIDHF